MFKYIHDLLPDMFRDFFACNADFHSYPTRNSNKLRPPLAKSKMASKFIKYTGVNYWNQLEDNIVKNLKIGTFKRHLKEYIFSTWIDVTYWTKIFHKTSNNHTAQNYYYFR